jgi:crotonobetainyl-CoA:carnitine CoA-transferase CaiB-like acyl-CoA transferase
MLCEGLRVIELANVLAGPSVGQFFAELGASVLKVEHPATGGDVTRSWKLPSEPKDSSISAYFSSVNWGKETRTLHLGRPEAREALYQWVAEADVVIASYKPGDAEKLGLDAAALHRLNPRLVYASITGYGPHDARAGYDAVIQAAAGFMHMNGHPDGAPAKMPVALIDVLAAHQLKEAILLALWRRERTGQGASVTVSLFDAAISALSNQATNWLNAKHLPKRMGSDHPNIAPYGSLFRTADQDEILLAIGTDKQFESLLEVLGLTTQEKFATNAQRVANRAELLPWLQQAIEKQESGPLLEELAKRHVPSARVNNLRQVFEMPEAQALLLRDEASGLRGVRQWVAQTNFTEYRQLSPPPPFRPD